MSLSFEVMSFCNEGTYKSTNVQSRELPIKNRLAANMTKPQTNVPKALDVRITGFESWNSCRLTKVSVDISSPCE